MKIIHTPARFFPYCGGTENYTYYLCRELVRLGEEILVFCANEPLNLKEEIKEGIRIRRLSYPFKIANTNITLSLPWRLLKEKCALIHTHLPHPWSADFSAWVCRIKNIPLVLTYHNDILGEGLNASLALLYNKTALAFLLKQARSIIITHRRYLEHSLYLKSYYKKIEVIPPGVDLERFKPLGNLDKVNSNRKEKVILFLGLLDEFHRYKGLEYLIQAMQIISKRLKEVKLFIGGEGKLKSYYKDLVLSLGLSAFVEFKGFLAQEELIYYYNRCDVFVLPSVSKVQEGFGIVLLEAMACGKPVVTTTVVGTAQRIKEAGAGIVVEPRDTLALANAILNILSEDTLAQEMAERALRLVREDYAWAVIAKKVGELYKRCLN